MKGDQGWAARGCRWLVATLLGAMGTAPHADMDTPASLVAPVVPLEHEALFWRDDRRVLFVGRRPIGNPGDHPARLAGPGIYTWDVQTGQVEEHRQPITGGLCFSDDHVSYLVRFGNPTVIATGALGRESDRSFPDHPDYLAWTLRRFFATTTCRHYEWERFPGHSARTHRIVPLAGTGLQIRFVNDTQGGAGAVLADADGDRVTQLPFSLRDVVTQRMRATRFLGRHFVYPVLGGQAHRPDGKCTRAWWIGGHDDIEAVCVPGTGEPDRVPTAVVPARDGYVLAQVHSGPSGWEADGVYHVAGVRRTRLAAGWVQNLAIAPGGCSVAFTLKPRQEDAATVAPPPRPSLVVADLCPTDATPAAAHGSPETGARPGAAAGETPPGTHEITLTTSGSIR